MNILERLGMGALHLLSPEQAHAASLYALRAGLAPTPALIRSPRLSTEIAGLKLVNPLGLAAGYDKNAVALAPLSKIGFGFIEVGAATPIAQPGNPKPRLFRLPEDRAAINRFGFNNEGSEVIARRLAAGPKTIPVGLNLGANKTSDDKEKDFAKVLRTCGDFIDFATVNVSSPNTEKLRDLQGTEALTRLLGDVMDARSGLKTNIPIFLKIAPDLSDEEICEIADVAMNAKIDAIIATNTTLERKGLSNAHREEAGGLSGAPLFEKSTRVLAQLSVATDGKIPLIGVGGVSSPKQAIEKILAGASAVQIYTGLVYEGLSLIPNILSGMDEYLAINGINNVADIVGTGRDAWL